ncbi:MAG: hypothetical protein AB9882_02490 [Ignavibacteriaceae bacterium]
MIHIDEYIVASGISRRSMFRKIERGELISVKRNGKTYIIETDKPEMLKEKEKQVIVAATKEEFDRMLAGCTSGDADQIRVFEEIQRRLDMLKYQEIEVKGYSLKSLYRKANDSKKIKRKSRCDKFTVKNRILDEILTSKVLPFASKVYIENAQPNLSLLCDLMKMYAKDTEDYYEIAAIPKGTLYRQIRLSFENSGISGLHKFMNHHNRFHIELPFCSGAFTNDIKFMDYIIGDDHKADVAKVFVYDEASNRVIEKMVKTWFWIEARTMMPLGWIIKIGDITSRDLIASLSVVFKKYGLPNTAVMVDNGIARAEDFTNFLQRLNRPEAYAHFSAPYTPINKAPVERGFGLIKSEFDAFFDNFVSPDKNKDARHSGLKMSPEETNIWFEDYRLKLENFVQTKYIERERIRTIDGERKRISILEYFDSCWTNHNMITVTNQALRWALCKDEIVKIGLGDLKFKGEYFISQDIMSPRFYNRKYRVLYSDDLSEVDLYAIEDMPDSSTGEILYKNTYFLTMQNLKTIPNQRDVIAKLRNKIQKQFKELSQNITSLKVADFEKALPTYVSEDGKKLVNTRRAFEQKVEAELKLSVSTINPIDSPEPEPKITGTKLTFKRRSLTTI